MRYLLFLIVIFVILFSTPAGTYVTEGDKWPEARTVFHVDIPGADGLWDDAFEAAMFRWNDATNFKFRIVRDSFGDPCSDPNVSAAKNGVAFSDSICGLAWSDQIIAISITWVINNTNEIVQTGVVFNSDEEWGVYSGPWERDPVCLQKVLDKWGIKIGEGFRFPNTFYRSIKQPLKCNYISFAEALCFS